MLNEVLNIHSTRDGSAEDGWVLVFLLMNLAQLP